MHYTASTVEDRILSSKRKSITAKQAFLIDKPSFEVIFFVPGIPATGGSKRGFLHPKTKKIMIVDSCSRNKPWREHVAAVAYDHKPDIPITKPIAIHVDFILPRPKSHYGTGSNASIVKRSSPKYHTKKPDTTKLFRALEDALTGIIWRDDEQVIKQYVTKNYGDNPGALVTIKTIDE